MTIEERASNLCGCAGCPATLIGGGCKKKCAMYIFYIKGATEQKAIDIDKACEWLKKNANDYTPYGEIVDEKSLAEDFKYAMEKQL